MPERMETAEIASSSSPLHSPHYSAHFSAMETGSYLRHAARRSVGGRESEDREPKQRGRDRDRDRDLADSEREDHRRDLERHFPRRPITRVNRACNGCRRAKIRCIGAEHPPCDRCYASGMECVVEKPPNKDAKEANSAVEDRLHSLEAQMGAMRDLLERVVRAVPSLDEGSREASASPWSPHWSSDAMRLSGERRLRDAGGSRSGRNRRRSPSKETQGASEPPEPARTPGHPEPPEPPTARGRHADPLAMEEMINPIGGFRAMTRRMEEEGNAPKRQRLASPSLPGEGDLIDQGVISEAEAASLVDRFYAGCSEFINAYDPTYDNFTSLRRRSTFSLTAVMMVGARARDGGGPPSPAQVACAQATRRMAMHTLMDPGVGVEDVKALVLLAAYRENGWLIAGHAVRIAIDLGLDRAFQKLVQGGMGHGKSKAELEKERALVERARVWYVVYRLEHQQSYGMGRPAIVREDSTIHNCRLLLDHPLSLDADARLVYAVELIALRAPLHVELTATPDLPLDAATLARLRWANEQFDSWERHWDEVLVSRYGTGSTGFVRESLAMQRQLAELFINSQLLRGVQSRADVDAMSAEKRALALRALGNALKCGQIALQGTHYTLSFPYGTHYTHVCAAFAASFLIRIARLFPEELDLDAVAKDVEGIADMLEKVPAGRYARSLRLILRRARREGILPAAPDDAGPSRRRDADTHAAGTETLAPTPTGDWLASLDIKEAELSAAAAASPLRFDGAHDLSGLGIGIDAFSGHAGALPLFLNGELGTSVRPSDAVNFVGLEDFFVPPELDTLLAGFEDRWKP